jgi:putative ABC transport system permease protein
MMEDAILLISVFAYGFIILMAFICVANIVNTISTSLALRKREFAMLKSVGMTDKAFNKMIAYESAFYGIKALLFGLPVGTLVMLIVRMSISEGYTMTLGVPWMGYVIAILGVFIVIGVTMLYSAKKIKKANVIDALRQENV